MRSKGLCSLEQLGSNNFWGVVILSTLSLLMLAACGDTTTSGAPNLTTSSLAASNNTPANSTFISNTTSNSASNTTSSPNTTTTKVTTTAQGSTGSNSPTSSITISTTNLPSGTASTAGTIAVPAGWKTFTSTQGGFSVLMPDNPQEKDQVSSTSAGNVNIISYLWTSPDNRLSYLSNYFDYPSSLLQGKSADSFLIELVNGQEEHLNGTSIGEKAIMLGSIPGRQAVYKSKVGSIDSRTISRAYLDGNRVYQLLVLFDNDKTPPDSNLTAFFDSFKIISKP